MPVPESELLMLSGLQHILFCERQWALIHLEQQWEENMLTAIGNILHDKVHSAKTEQRGGLRIVRALHIVSYNLGLAGQTDAVEFYKVSSADQGIQIKGLSGLWRPYPVEYKKGKPKADYSDEVQLCAQAICLEEMLNVRIMEGALFYGKNKRRKQVTFDDNLRRITEETAQKIHLLFSQRITPQAEYSKKCNACSLVEICLPKRTSKKIKIEQYINKMVDTL